MKSVVKLLLFLLVCGLFASLNFPPFQISAQSTTGACSVDVTQDQKVDRTDYDTITSSLLGNVKSTAFDLNSDYRLDLSDYASFSAKFATVTNCEALITNKFYVSPTGNDTNTGTTAAQPFATLAKAIDTVKTSGKLDSVIFMMPGIYRQRTDITNLNGNPTSPVTITAQLPGTVTISGGQNSQSLTWTKGEGGLSFPAAAIGKVYYADVSSWNAEPQIAVHTSGTTVKRLPIAMEPDIDIYQPTTTTDPRWTADGIDATQTLRSLVDGDLKTINGFNSSFLTGAAFYIKDTYSAHDELRAIAVSHDPVTGTVILDRDLKYYTGSNLVGNKSKYYVEGKSQLLDNPGEWVYDPVSKRIYIWSPTSVNPAQLNIEFGLRPVGIMVRNSSNIVIKNINFTAINYLYTRNFNDEAAILISNRDAESTSNITVDNVKISHSGVGVRIYQSTNQRKLTQNIRVKNSVIEYTDGIGLNVFHWPNKDANGNTIPGNKGIYIENNEISYSGFRPGGVMVWLQQTQNISIRNNFIHHSAHNGVEVQGGQTTNMLVANNLFADNCIIASDCGGFKVWASGTSMHNVLVMNNVSRGTQGCSNVNKVENDYVSSKGDGCGGFGYYTDIVASAVAGEPAVSFFRNLAVDNYYSGAHFTRSQDMIVSQNLWVNNPAGIRAVTTSNAREKMANSKVQGNIWINTNNTTPKVINTFGTASSLFDVGPSIPLDPVDRPAINIDGNAYMTSGIGSRLLYTRPLNNFGLQANYATVEEIRQNTPWEVTGKQVNFSSLPTTNAFDAGGYFRTAGISLIAPTEVQVVISRLQLALGANIPTDTWIGRR